MQSEIVCIGAGEACWCGSLVGYVECVFCFITMGQAELPIETNVIGDLQ